MKYRYLIECDVQYGEDGYTTTRLEPGDDDGRSSGFYTTVQEAKDSVALHFAQEGQDEPVWKDPPAAWLPHAMTVTQYVDDGVEPNRDR